MNLYEYISNVNTEFLPTEKELKKSSTKTALMSHLRYEGGDVFAQYGEAKDADGNFGDAIRFIHQGPEPLDDGELLDVAVTVLFTDYRGEGEFNVPYIYVSKCDFDADIYGDVHRVELPKDITKMSQKFYEAISYNLSFRETPDSALGNMKRNTQVRFMFTPNDNKRIQIN